MNAQTPLSPRFTGKSVPSSPKTPPRQVLSWKSKSSPNNHPIRGGSGPGYSSTPSSTKKRSRSHHSYRSEWEEGSPSRPCNRPSSSSAKSTHQFGLQECKQNPKLVQHETDFALLGGVSKHLTSSLATVSKTHSSADSNGTVTVELDFPSGGWNEESSDEASSCSLEIVESESELNASPKPKSVKRKFSEVLKEDNPILSGMGEEIERQLEAKAERNRLTVPNVKNILRSVITNPFVQAMVRRSIKTGDVAVSGDAEEMSFEPIMTRAKAKLLCDSDLEKTWSKISEVSWPGTPIKVSQSSECHTLISDDLNEDSEDDEEYQPCEEDASDIDQDRDGSERGSERDTSIEQSHCSLDTDTESCPATPTPSPKPHIIDCATQTNWSEDGIFKVPSVPPEPVPDQSKDENIALRTRSKLPLNEIPLEEIEQAFIPPDITPDLYDTTCDNADWQEFLKEFMQPMRSEPDVQNHDDDEEDPEYNVLADEEIIDQEELRMDRAVKVSKRELNELMKELAELNDNMSSDEDEKIKENDKGFNSYNTSPGHSNIMSCNEEMSIFIDAVMSMGNLTPVHKAGSQSSRSPSLHTPVPPMSPPSLRTPGSGKKNMHCYVSDDVEGNELVPSSTKDSAWTSSAKLTPLYSYSEKKPSSCTSFENCMVSSSGNQRSLTPGKFVHEGEELNTIVDSGKDMSFPSPMKECLFQTSGIAWEQQSVGNDNINADPSALDSSNLVSNTWSSANTHHQESASFISQSDEALDSDHSTSESLSKANATINPIDVEARKLLCAFSKLHIYKPMGKVEMSADGDVVIDNTVILSSVQRLVLDQQMRQYVQILTQHFLQTFKHPILANYAAGCKEKLIVLQSLKMNKEKSAFEAANLAPALEAVSSWEEQLSSEEGPSIISFMEEQCLTAEKKKNLRKTRNVEKFPQQLMDLMVASTAFVYPKLLPSMPFSTCGFKRNFILPSEVHLLAIGMEEFGEFIKENNPKLRGCLRLVLNHICEYILTGRNPQTLELFVRKSRSVEGSPIEYYEKHNCAPPTSHYVAPFNEKRMVPLKDQPHNVLPPLWRDFLYPAYSC